MFGIRLLDPVGAEPVTEPPRAEPVTEPPRAEPRGSIRRMPVAIVIPLGCAGLGALTGLMIHLAAPRAVGWLGIPIAAFTFAGLAWALGPTPELPGYLFAAGVGLLLSGVDRALLRLPNRLVGVALLGGPGALATVSLVDGCGARLLRATLAGLVMATGYAIPALLPGRHVGMGDVKLSGVLGVLLGWLGWPLVLAGVVLAHMVNGPVALFQLVRHGAHRRAVIPFGPALLSGAFLAVLITYRPH